MRNDVRWLCVALLVLSFMFSACAVGFAVQYKDPGISALYSRRVNNTTRVRVELRNDCESTLGEVLRFIGHVPVVGHLASEIRDLLPKRYCSVVTTYRSYNWGGATRVTRR